jgi:hypothetical protein
MLTKLVIRNFKRFGEVEIELGDSVVFVGPNNSGKTTALQALALWDLGLRRWLERRGGKATPAKRPGVTINRRDVAGVPVPAANLLWRDLHVRDTRRVSGKPSTQNVRIEILVEGVAAGDPWRCGFEFDFANDESFYCRPLRIEGTEERMAIPAGAMELRFALLPPMSGLLAEETRLEWGAINVRLGEGRTAEVLRNLCYQVFIEADGWVALRQRIESLFGVVLEEPKYIAERGEITMRYRDAKGTRLDLSAAGRGLQQTLLLFAYLTLNPLSVLLIDEPDAHLEILRQRQIYQILTEAARTHGSQIIMASHSEVILNEAADRDVVIAFVGTPHRVDDRGSQVLKSLKEIGFDQFYQAEQTGWVLYLEGATDLAILRAFAEVLGHPAANALERPFVRYVQNQPGRAREHFFGLRAAKPDLVGFALFDRLDYRLEDNPHLRQRMWGRREIENYLSQRETLQRWAADEGARLQGPLFAREWQLAMDETLAELEGAAHVFGRPLWSTEIKASDEFLVPLFDRYFERRKLPNLLRKTDFHVLARFVSVADLDPEVSAVLDDILATRNAARPFGE